MQSCDREGHTIVLRLLFSIVTFIRWIVVILRLWHLRKRNEIVGIFEIKRNMKAWTKLLWKSCQVKANLMPNLLNVEMPFIKFNEERLSRGRTTTTSNSCIGKPSIKWQRSSDVRFPNHKHLKQSKSLTSALELQVVFRKNLQRTKVEDTAFKNFLIGFDGFKWMKGVKTKGCRKWKVFGISYKLYHRYCRTLVQFNEWGDLTGPGLFPWNNEDLDSRFNLPSGCWRLNSYIRTCGRRREGSQNEFQIPSTGIWNLQGRIKYGLTKTATNKI